MRLNDMSTSELITTAHSYAGSIKEIGIYSELVKELTTRLAASTAAANEGSKHAARADALAAENSYLLPKAASELSNAWMLHKYWVGIHVALMHVRAGRLNDGMEWLQNTVAGPGIEVPRLSNFDEIEVWAIAQQKDSIGHERALEIIKAETPATDSIYAGIKADGVEWTEGDEPDEFGRYWIRYETDTGPRYCSAQWMEHNFCASSDTNIHKIWLADHSRSINSLKGVTHYTKLPAALEGGAL